MFSYLLTIAGPKFYPSKLSMISRLRIANSRDYGEINKAGRTIESGYICVEGDSINELHSIALEIKKESHVMCEIEFSVIRIYDEQCNLEFSKIELQMIAELDAHLSISCSKNS